MRASERRGWAECHFRLQGESCGIDVDQGASPLWEAVQAALRLGVDLRGHHSKGLDGCDTARADLILPMEYWQYRRLVTLFPGKKANIRLLREFPPGPSGLLCNIYDPYGLTERNFDVTFRLVQRAVNRMQTQLEASDG